MLVGVVLFALNLRGPLVAISTVATDLNTDLGMSSTAIGLLTSLPVLCFGLAAPGASSLIARTGVERSVLLSLLGVLVGVLVRSLGGIPAALAGTVIMGLAITIGNVVSPGDHRAGLPRPGGGHHRHLHRHHERRLDDRADA